MFELNVYVCLFHCLERSLHDLFMDQHYVGVDLPVVGTALPSEELFVPSLLRSHTVMSVTSRTNQIIPASRVPRAPRVQWRWPQS